MNDYLNFDRVRCVFTSAYSLIPKRTGAAFGIYVFWAIGSFLGVTATAQEEIRFPYQALIASEKAMVRSGPGDLHYGTERLDQGASVEVFRHDPGNWCAIRPLESSFSLVPESTLKMIRDGVGEVIVEDARAWVGTHLGAVEKPLWQVKLRQGERLKVVGEVAFPNPDGHSTIWYQIKPPPGEFRWIHRDDIRGLVSTLPNPSDAVGGVTNSVAGGEPVKAELMRSVPQIDTAGSFKSNRTTPDARSRPALPQPDLNTRDDRIVGSGLRRDLQIDSERRSNEDLGLGTNRSIGLTGAGRGTGDRPFEVKQADFVDDVERMELPQNVQLASNQQEVVGPQDREGINEGWRPSTRPFGKLASRAVETLEPPRRAAVEENRESWNPTQPSESFADESQQFQNQGFASPRFADAAPMDRVFARGLGDARSRTNVEIPVLGTYTQMPSGVAAVEARLTQEMLKSDPALWDLDSLERKAQALSQNPNSAEELVNVNRLIAKIQKCQQLKFQYANERGPMGRFDLDAAEKSGSPASRNGSDVNQDVDSQFDAVGWLNELKREQGTARSTYVLQDATGKITHHLAAAPGLNLSRYLKTRIGVVGKRGYHQGLKLDHVLVSRVYGL